MPTQKDNARCNRAAPVFNPHGSGGYTPTPKNHETNPIYTSPSLAHDPPPAIMRNEPNLPPARHPERRAAERSAAAQSRGICQITIAAGDSKQTNHARTPIMRNEPNLPPPRTCGSQKTRNEPNFHPDPQSIRTGTACRAPTSRNKPNLPHRASPAAPAHPKKYETNPISPAPDNLPVRARSRRAGMPLQYETNPIPARFKFTTLAKGQSRCTSENPIRPHSHSTQAKNPKRTQFTPPSTSHIYNPQYTIYNPPGQFPNAQTKANSLCINDLNKIGDSCLFQHHPPPRTGSALWCSS